MTRTLPWLKNASATKKTSSPSSIAKASPVTTRENHNEPTPKRRRISPPSASDDDSRLDTTGVATRSKRRLLQDARTPSTSPPPAPPEKTLMREGFAEDDIWMMVEDEFYATAQSFTHHLHHAEYQRLKKARLSPTMPGNKVIIPSVDGKTKASVERQTTRGKERQDRDFGHVNSEQRQEDDGEQEDPWIGTQLAGLMDSPRKVQRLKARGLGQGRSETRAAKGFTRASSPTSARKQWRHERNMMAHKSERTKRHKGNVEQEGEDQGDDDDLDTVIVRAKRGRREAQPEPAPNNPVPPRTEKHHLDEEKRHPSPRPSPSVTTKSTTGGLSRFERRRAERARLEKEKKEKEQRDKGTGESIGEVPTFLF